MACAAEAWRGWSLTATDDLIARMEQRSWKPLVPSIITSESTRLISGDALIISSASAAFVADCAR